MNIFCTFWHILAFWTSLLVLVTGHPQSQQHESDQNVGGLGSKLVGQDNNNLNAVNSVIVNQDEGLEKNQNKSGHVSVAGGAGREKRQSLWQTTTRGTSCDGRCGRQGTDYYWCRTKRWSGETSWDYCSPWEGIDYYGNVCQQPCGFQGYSYKWCYVTTVTGSSTWGYCSSQSSLLSYNFP